MALPEASDADQSFFLSDATLAALELPQQPFGQLQADSASFSDETTAEQIADVKQALITGDDLLLILGEQGAGKTVMLKQLGEQSGNRIQCFSVKGSERFSTMNLFAGLLEAFKHSPPEKLQDILNDLIPYLQTMITRNVLSVIVLDDAHTIKETELTHLLSAMLYINSHDETVMRIAMAAPPEFEDRIPDLLPEGADLPYSSLTITGMTSAQALDFIEFRMQQAGLPGGIPLSESELGELTARSGGLPGPLQTATAHALNEQHGPISQDTNTGLSRIAPSVPILQSRFGKMALGGVAVFCIILGILMFMPGKSNENAGRYTTSRTEPVNLNDSSTELRLVDSTTTSVDTQSDSSSVSTIPRVTISKPATSELLVRQSPSTEASTGAATSNESVTPRSTESVNSLSTGSVPDMVSDETTRIPIVTESDTAAESQPIVIVAASPESSASDTVTRAPVPGDAAQTTVTSAPRAAAVPIEPAQALDNNSQTSANQVGALESSSWILLQDRALYTVQMSASRDRDSVVNFLNIHSDALPAPNSIYTFTRDGSNWYALLHGLYESIDAARTAVETMPAKALTNQPWIRSVARVQEVLKAQ